MSAIAGILQLNDEPVRMEQANLMMSALQHHPADDIQVWHQEQIFLGCHAQWITPESVGEPLPYWDKSRQLAITADAIIDNREDLFDRLEIDRELRRKLSDSQLILKAYSQWGEETPRYLAGDFAFMIWDAREQKLFGARDFSGGRTLYYHHGNERFSFSTLIEPLALLPDVGKRLNEQWLAQFLAITGMVDVVDTAISPYQSIHQLPPAHSIVVRGRRIMLKRYCSFDSIKPLTLHSNADYVEAFQEVFQQAVSSRLRTHRNIAAQLSGGLDSGAVVSFAAESLRGDDRPLHTYSYVPPSDFEDFTPKHLLPNERPLIESTVRHVGRVKEHYLDFPGRNPYLEIDDVLNIMEMPYKFFENSFWLKGMYEKSHEDGVGVLLNGGRGNLSISWGAALTFYSVLLKKFKWLRLWQELNRYSQNTGGARLGLLPYISKMAFPWLSRDRSPEQSERLPIIIHPDFAKRTSVYQQLEPYGIDYTGWFSESDIYKQRKHHFEDLFHWNASNTLAAKLSLPYGVWKRDPTNDLRVIRFCLAIPEDQYVQDGMDRALIRRATEHLLPDNIRLNQRVRGVQGADWVHRMAPVWNSFVDELDQMVQDADVMQYLNGKRIRPAIDNIRAGARPNYMLDPDSKVLMRSLIVYRFIKRFERR